MNHQRTYRADTFTEPKWRELSRNPHDRRMTPAEVAAEVTWLIGTDAPVSIAHRLGFASLPALIRFLQRADRHDLAVRVTPLSLRPASAGDQLGCSSLNDLTYRALHRRRVAAA